MQMFVHDRGIINNSKQLLLHVHDCTSSTYTELESYAGVRGCTVVNITWNAHVIGQGNLTHLRMTFLQYCRDTGHVAVVCLFTLGNYLKTG